MHNCGNHVDGPGCRLVKERTVATAYEEAPGLAAIWSAALAGLSDELPPQHRAWIELTRPLAIVDGTALLAAPNDFAKDVLDSRLRPLIVTALARELGCDIRVTVIVDPLSTAAGDPVSSASPAEPDPPYQPVGRDGGTRQIEPARLNPKYQFGTFVIGDSNRFSHAAAVAVAEAPARAYSPLFIYGDSGLGKTHLLHAIGHYTQRLFAGSRVRYASSEEFTNEFINSVRDGKAYVFQRRYRDIDVLLIDDIQFLEHKERTQEEFFHTFNTLHNNSKQIVISSDRPPKELTTLDDRLRNRMEWGLVTDVQSPDLETRIAILRKKAASERLDAPPEVLEYIADKIPSNVRELEGALLRVTAFGSLNRQPIDLPLAEIVLKDVLPSGGGPEITAATIMAATSSYFGVSMEDLCGSSRSRNLVTARQIAMYICRELTTMSLPKIGQQFGNRDHTTVMHADRKIRALMAERRTIYNQVTELSAKVKAQARR